MTSSTWRPRLILEQISEFWNFGAGKVWYLERWRRALLTSNERVWQVAHHEHNRQVGAWGKAQLRFPVDAATRQTMLDHTFVVYTPLISANRRVEKVIAEKASNRGIDIYGSVNNFAIISQANTDQLCFYCFSRTHHTQACKRLTLNYTTTDY